MAGDWRTVNDFFYANGAAIGLQRMKAATNEWDSGADVLLYWVSSISRLVTNVMRSPFSAPTPLIAK